MLKIITFLWLTNNNSRIIICINLFNINKYYLFFESIYYLKNISSKQFLITSGNYNLFGFIDKFYFLLMKGKVEF